MPQQNRSVAYPDTSTAGRIIAHRGASRIAPENTLGAFRAAARQGARWLEFDVALLGDGTPVVHHDATLDRCTNQQGPLTALAAGDLADVDAGSWFDPTFAGEPLPRLDQALDLIEALDLSANLEMKLHGAAPDALAESVSTALARRPWTVARILVSSFDITALECLRARLPRQPLAVLYEQPPAAWPNVLHGLRARSLHVAHECLDVTLAARARAEAMHLRVYTVNQPRRIEPFRGAGLAGVITDHPPLFLDDPAWAAWADAQAG